MQFTVPVEFLPKDQGLQGFLELIRKQLENMGLDVSAFNVDEIVAGFREAEEAIAHVQTELEALADTPVVLTPELDLPEIPAPVIPDPEPVHVPPVEVPPIEVPEIPTPELNLGDLAAEFDKVKKGLSEVADTQQKALAQLKLTGKEGTPAYKELSDQLDETKAKLEEINSAAGEEGKSFLQSFFEFEAIGKAGESLSGVADKGREVNRALADLQAQSGATDAELDGLRETAAGLFSGEDTLRGFESIGDALKAVGTARKALGDALDPAGLEAFTGGAAALGHVLDADVNEVIKKGAPFIKQFALEGQAGYELIALGAQQAGTSQDDFLDTVSEYSSVAKSAGVSAQEFIGILVRGGEEAAFNTDKIGDALKETQIRLNAGDISTAIAGLGEGVPEALRTKIEESVKAAEEGSLSVKDLLLRVTEATDQAGLDKAMTSKIQTAISGTPAEDLGTELYSKLFGAPIDEGQITARAALAGKQIKDTIASDNVFESITRQGEAAFAGIASFIAPVAAPLGGLLSTVGQVGPAFTLLEGKFSLFEKAGSIFSGLGSKILGLIPALGAQTVATGGAEVATVGLNATMLLNPAFLIVAGITALVAAFIIFSDSTKSVDDAVKDVNASLDDFNSKTAEASAIKEQGASLRDLAAEYDALKGKADPESQKRFAEVANELAQSVPGATDAVETLGAGAEKAGANFAISTGYVRDFADENDRVAAQAAEESLANLSDQAAALADSLHEAQAKQKELREDRDKLNAAVVATGDAAKTAGTSLQTFGNPFDSMADDLKDVKKDLGDTTNEVTKAEAAARKLVKQFKDSGQSVEQISELTGLSVEEVKKYSAEQVKAKGATDATGKSVTNIKTELQKTQEQAKLLGDKFAEAKKQASGFEDSAISALAQQLLALDSAQKAFLAAQSSGDAARTAAAAATLAAAKGNVEAAKTTARAAVSTAGEYDKFLKQAEILSGKTVVTVKAKTTIDAAKDVNEALAKLNNDFILSQSQEELQRNLIKLDQEKAQEVKGAKEKAEALKKQVAESKKADSSTRVVNQAAIKELEEGGKVQLAIERKYIDLRIKARVDAATKVLGEDSKRLSDNLNTQVELLKRQEETITGNSQEELEKRVALRAKELLLQQTGEVAAAVRSNDAFIAAYVALQDAQAALDEATTDEQRNEAQTRIAQREKELSEVETKIRTSDEKVGGIRLKFEKQLDAAIEEINKAAFDRDLALLQKRQARELAAREATAAQVQQLADDIGRIAEEQGSIFIEFQSSDATAQLDRLHNQRLIADDVYEQRKTEIARKGEEERSALSGRAIGMKLEAERQAALASLGIQQQQLQEQLALAEKNGQTAEADKVTEQLKTVEEQITQKGSLILSLSGELQTSLTDVFSNLITGDPEKAKEPFKKSFQILVGALQRTASAKVTQIVLDGIIPGLGLGGLFASLALQPFIESLINGILGPVFNSLLSFSTGARVDSPTWARIGDASASRIGSDTEWVLRDDQIRELMRTTINQFLTVNQPAMLVQHNDSNMGSLPGEELLGLIRAVVTDNAGGHAQVADKLNEVISAINENGNGGGPIEALITRGSIYEAFMAEQAKRKKGTVRRNPRKP